MSRLKAPSLRCSWCLISKLLKVTIHVLTACKFHLALEKFDAVQEAFVLLLLGTRLQCLEQ